VPGSASHPLRLKVLGTTELGGAEGGEARAILAQPKRFALLVWLALAGRGRFVRRDAVIASGCEGSRRTRRSRPRR
jgi:hypothetical protein